MRKHDHLRARLEARLAEIAGRVRRIETDLRRAADPDWTEQATLQENDEVLEGLDELGRQEAIGIRRALRRMESGDYGFCVECREPIDAKRLEALPTADKCGVCAR
jgi:RNA polymerase-binding transcription factor DksA